jgi:hypothetical protein
MYTNIGHINSKMYKLYYSNLNCTTENVNAINEDKNYQEKEKEIIQDLFFTRLTYIKRFCDIIILKKMSNEDNVDYYRDYIKIIEYFIKKIRKTNLSENFDVSLIVKSFSTDFEEKIKLYNPLKFVNWIFIY